LWCNEYLAGNSIINQVEGRHTQYLNCLFSTCLFYEMPIQYKKYMWIKKFKWLVLLFQLTSCISYKYIDIEFYDLPQKTIAEPGDNLLVVENLHIRNTDTPIRELDWALDSVASNEATDALISLLKTSPWYSGISLFKHIYYRYDSSRVVRPLSWQVIDSLSNVYNSKMIVSLEYLKVRPYYDTYPLWRGDFKEYYGFIQVSSYTYWRIYNVETRKINLGQLLTDTLLWEKNDWIEVTPGNQLPGIFEACAFAGADAGEQFARLIAPQWQKDSRAIYVPNANKEMNRAHQLAMLGNWLDAAAVWQRLSSSTSKELAAQAAFNMALANEMLGRFQLAIEWLDYAKSKYPHLKFLKEYRDILQHRIENNKSQK